MTKIYPPACVGVFHVQIIAESLPPNFKLPYHYHLRSCTYVLYESFVVGSRFNNSLFDRCRNSNNDSLFIEMHI